MTCCRKPSRRSSASRSSPLRTSFPPSVVTRISPPPAERAGSRRGAVWDSSASWAVSRIRACPAGTAVARRSDLGGRGWASESSSSSSNSRARSSIEPASSPAAAGPRPEPSGEVLGGVSAGGLGGTFRSNSSFSGLPGRLVPEPRNRGLPAPEGRTMRMELRSPGGRMRSIKESISSADRPPMSRVRMGLPELSRRPPPSPSSPSCVRTLRISATCSGEPRTISRLPTASASMLGPSAELAPNNDRRLVAAATGSIFRRLTTVTDSPAPPSSCLMMARTC